MRMTEDGGSREKQSVSRYVLKMKLEYSDSFGGEIECISKGGLCMRKRERN